MTFAPLRSCWLTALFLFLAVAARGQRSSLATNHWYKGNTHAHTWFSDGDSPPELVAAWYKDHGYHFLLLTDHNSLDDKAKWTVIKRISTNTLARHAQAFGTNALKMRPAGTNTEYRLPSLRQVRRQLENPGQFLLLPGEEISDTAEKRPVHLCGINLPKQVAPQKGKTTSVAVANNLRAIAALGRKSQPVLATLNHPNFGWALTAEDIYLVPEVKLMEVFNGHPSVRNYGDDLHASVERMWDIALAKRLAELHLPVIYGVASDDTHHLAPGGATPARGWVMVGAPSLTTTNIVRALDQGNFYASTGVVLDRIDYANGTLRIVIQARPGITYTTQFIGTMADYDPTVTTRQDAQGNRVTGSYSPGIGWLLAEQAGPCPAYTLTGKEIYVRAKIISSAPHPDPFQKGDTEVAWTQPIQTRQPAFSLP